MASADYNLVSSLHREVGGYEQEVRTAELEMIAEAREWGLGVHPTGYVDDLQLLSDLQHYGIATRLIDVTSNPMTALWFACQDPQGTVSKSGLLLALNITGWDRMSTVADPEGVYRGRAPTAQGARLDRALSTPKPFVVESAIPNDRLRAQEGFFVTGQIPVDNRVPVGDDSWIWPVTPFTSINVDWPRGDADELQRRLTEPRDVGAPRSLPFVAMLITPALKGKLLKYLSATYNRSSRVLFPDYEGYRQFGEHVPRRSPTGGRAP